MVSAGLFELDDADMKEGKTKDFWLVSLTEERRRTGGCREWVRSRETKKEMWKRKGWRFSFLFFFFNSKTDKYIIEIKKQIIKGKIAFFYVRRD